METDWFGFAMILGVVAVGTPLLFVVYKIVASVWGRFFSSGDAQSRQSENVTPHALLSVAVLLTVAFIIPVFLMVSYPNRGGWTSLVWWGASITLLVLFEKWLVANQSYKNSWWCRPLGKSTDTTS
jgi:hypothetical protein